MFVGTYVARFCLNNSVKDRDAEIVLLRQREQASGGWIPPLHQPPGAAALGAPLPAGVGEGVPGGGAFMTPTPPRGNISRGEQAGQEVLAHLSRLQAAATGSSGGPLVGPPRGMSAGILPAPGDHAGPGVGPAGFGPYAIHNSHLQRNPPPSHVPHAGGDAVTMHQLQAQVRRYQQALIAMGGAGAGPPGPSASGRRAACVQVAQ